MKTIKYQKSDIKKIKEDLLKGCIVAFPTDTVFGLACIYDNKEVINKIYKAKGRSFNKPLPMMCDSLEMMEKIAYVDDDTRKIIKKFTPGPLTLILKKKKEDSELKTIGIRIPNDKWILDLIKEIGKPILVTSANLSDKGSLMRCIDVYQDMKDRIDGIVMEDAKSNIPSTIIDTTDGLKIIREGAISKEEIERCIK